MEIQSSPSPRAAIAKIVREVRDPLSRSSSPSSSSSSRSLAFYAHPTCRRWTSSLPPYTTNKPILSSRETSHRRCARCYLTITTAMPPVLQGTPHHASLCGGDGSCCNTVLATYLRRAAGIPREAGHNLIIPQRHALDLDRLFAQTVLDSKDVSGGYPGCIRAGDLCEVRPSMAVTSPSSHPEPFNLVFPLLCHDSTVCSPRVSPPAGSAAGTGIAIHPWSCISLRMLGLRHHSRQCTGHFAAHRWSEAGGDATSCFLRRAGSEALWQR